jgi:hypothetical protein
MAGLPNSLCVFPLFSFSWSIPTFTLKLPFLPNLNFSIDFSCPLD